MNWKYDTSAAEIFLNAYIARADQEGSSMPSLRNLNLAECRVVPFSGPPCMRLVKGEEENMEEVTCRIPGIISSKVLPPVTGPLRSNQFSHVRLLRQYVRLTGLDSPLFLENEAVLDAITQMFRSSAGGEEFEGIAPQQYEGFFAIDTHTRYLTERRLVPSERHIPFPPEVDPNHALDNARGIHFVRTGDNVVEYGVRREGPDGRASFDSLPPGDFKEGDLVDASVTFLAFPLGKENTRESPGYKLVVALRGLTLLTSEYREKSKITASVAPRVPNTRGWNNRPKSFTAKGLKRKYVPYSTGGRRSSAQGEDSEMGETS